MRELPRGTSFVQPKARAAVSTTLPSKKRSCAGEPFTLEHFEQWALRLILDNGEPWVLQDFQAGFIEDIFGGAPENWLVEPEGNGKTTLIAGLGLYGLRFAPDANIPVAASSRDQAKVLYLQAKGFLQRSSLNEPGVSFEAFDGYKRIDIRTPGKTKRGEVAGFIQVHAADAGTGDGVIPFPYAFVDELHRHRSMSLYETWRGKVGKRGAQIVTISIGGEAGSAFEETRDRVRQETPVLERRPGFIRCVSDEAVFHEYALEEGADPEDMEAVKRCNPLSTITTETLAAKRRSPTMSPSHWARFTCNLATRSLVAAIAESEWHDAATSEPIPDDVDVWLGLDVGFQWDTTALVPFAWISDTHRQFGPATVLEPPGGGEQLDVRVIKRAVVEMQARYRVSTVVMDSSRAEDIAAWMSDELGLTVVYRAQTFKPQAEDYERFMAALRQGWLLHAGDAGLRRHALNAVTKLLPDGGAKFGRSSESRLGRQDSRVIDALVAAAMVHSVRCEPPTPVYRTRSRS